MDNNILMTMLRQELKEVFYSKFIWFVSLFYLVFFLLFVFVGLRESSVHGFTGMSRVLFSLAHTLVFFLPLLALTTSSTVITQYRENGSLEFFFSNPIPRNTFFLSLTLSRLLVLVGPLVLLLFFTWVVFLIGNDRQSFNLLFQLKFLLVSSSLLWCFLSIGFYLSEKARSQIKAIVLMLVIWLFAIALMDFALIGIILKFNLNAESIFFLAMINPIQGARLALLSELNTELSTLGAVGFFVSHLVGKKWMFVLGVMWPVFLGILFWWSAYKSFEKNNII